MKIKSILIKTHLLTPCSSEFRNVAQYSDEQASNVIEVRFGAANDSSRLPGAEKSRQVAGIVGLPSECGVKGGKGGCRVSRKKRDCYTINSQMYEKLCPITPSSERADHLTSLPMCPALERDTCVKFLEGAWIKLDDIVNFVTHCVKVSE